MSLYSVKETAKLLGISKSLIYALAACGQLRCSRHGMPGRRGVIRFTEESIKEYLVACEASQQETPLRHLR